MSHDDDAAEFETRDAELAPEPRINLFGFGTGRRRSPSPDSESDVFRTSAAAKKREYLSKMGDGPMGSDSDDSDYGSAPDTPVPVSKIRPFLQPRKRKAPAPSPARRRPSVSPSPAPKRHRLDEKHTEREAPLGEQLRQLDPQEPGVRGGPIAGLVMEAKDKPPRPRSERKADWARLDDEEPEQNPGWCAMCKVSQRAMDVGADNPFYADVPKFAEDNWAKISAEEMGTQLQEKYNRNIRPYITPEEMRLPCHKSMFYKHFVFHERTTRITLEEVATGMQLMIDNLLQDEDDDRGVTNNVKKGTLFMKLVDRKMAVDKTLASLRPNAVL